MSFAQRLSSLDALPVIGYRDGCKKLAVFTCIRRHCVLHLCINTDETVRNLLNSNCTKNGNEKL